MNQTPTRHGSVRGWQIRAFLLGHVGEVCFGLLGAVCSLGCDAADADARPKAESIYYMAKLVEWPTNAFANAQSPFTIGVLGEESFVASLREVVKGRSIGSRRIEVVSFNDPDEVGSCHILFLRRVDPGRVKAVLERVSGKSVLTVGESDDFLADGGMIQFAEANGVARFKIHLETAQKSGLQIGSKLLFLALPVYRPPPPHGE